VILPDNIKISVVIPVLNSHEVLRRQLTYMGKFVQDDTEIIIVDDGSDPPLEVPEWVKVIRTNDKRPWTWASARNKGAKEAVGKWLLMFDIDHFIDAEIFDILREYDGDKVIFQREFGVLDESGTPTQDLETLVKYGFPQNRFKKRGLKITALPNNFAMKREVFFDIGGYREDFSHRPYPQGEDRYFKKGWLMWERANNGQYYKGRPKIYMFPNGYLCGDKHVDFNPFGLFHTLTRATKRNHWHRRKK
jgi:glycosyltransferase involved in cell wall biosynthesis